MSEIAYEAAFLPIARETLCICSPLSSEPLRSWAPAQSTSPTRVPTPEFFHISSSFSFSVTFSGICISCLIMSIRKYSLAGARVVAQGVKPLFIMPGSLASINSCPSCSTTNPGLLAPQKAKDYPIATHVRRSTWSWF